MELPNVPKSWLDDLNPQTATVYLHALGKSVELRPVNVADITWMKQKFGDKLKSVLDAHDLNGLCQVFFRLLPEDVKAEFKAKDVTLIDEETGEEKKVRLGGAGLFESQITGLKEFKQIYWAFMETLGVSMPKVDPDAEKKTELKVEEAPGLKSLTA